MLYLCCCHFIFYSYPNSPYDAERQHWVTSSLYRGEVLLFDSSSTGRVSVALQSQLVEIYKNAIKDDMLMVTIVPMQQQNGPFDCGLFSIAAAYNVALGKSLRSVTFEQSDMRSHLMQCFADCKLSPFPVASTVDVTRCALKHVFIHVYCLCLNVESYDDNMIQCDSCQRWYHFKCVQIEQEPPKWCCSRCNFRADDVDPSSPSVEEAVKLLREMSEENLLKKFAEVIEELNVSLRRIALYTLELYYRGY